MYWSVALDVCNNLVLNDKDDWRLPTKNELQKLYASRDLIGGFNTTNIPLYWSSTDDPSNTSYAMCIWFDSGQENPIYKTAYQERVRAVRSF